MKKIIAVVLFVGSSVLGSDYSEEHKQVPLLRYHNNFADFYPKLSHSYRLDGLALEQTEVVLDSHQTVKATIVRTDGSVVPYEKNLSNITIEGVDIELLQISLKGFRNIRVEWLGSNLLFFDVNIGHIASVECLLDVRERKWVYSKSISYNKHSKLRVVPVSNH